MMALASVVVFSVTYALILPAITLERYALCGLEEHTHTGACYELLHDEVIVPPEQRLCCSAESLGVHTHDGSCYDALGALVCGCSDRLIHVHNELCFDEDGWLDCPLTEDYGHEHGEGCYLTQQELICSPDEDESHTHDDTCYETQTVLQCAGRVLPHTHDESCYDGGALVCGILQTPEHTHSGSCLSQSTIEYVEREELICDQKEHEHNESCWPDEEAEPQPDMEERPAGDPTADVETAQDWEATLNDLPVTGVWAEDLLTVGDSQVGYHESTKNFIYDENGVQKGYSRYGQWYGDLYGDWCAMYVSFCLSYAGIPEEVIPPTAGCQYWVGALTELERFVPRAEAQPKPGDLIFFDKNEDGLSEHVAIVYHVARDGTITYLEGNSIAEDVGYSFILDSAEAILGYGILPENPEEPEFACGIELHIHRTLCYDQQGELLCECEEHLHDEACPAWLCGKRSHAHGESCYDEAGNLTCLLEEHTHDDTCLTDQPEETPAYTCGKQEHIHEENCFAPDGTLTCLLEEHTHDDTCLTQPDEDSLTLDDSFTYTDDVISMTVHVSGTAKWADEAPAEEIPAEELLADGLISAEDIPAETPPAGDAPTELTAAYLDENSEAYEKLLAFAVEQNGEEELFQLLAMELSLSKGGRGLDLSGCQLTAEITVGASALTPPDTMTLEAAEEAEQGVVVTALGDQDQSLAELDSVLLEQEFIEPVTLTVQLSGSTTVAVTAAGTPNPKFTVQYFAWLNEVADSGDESKTLDVIDTSGKGEGGVLPQNGKTPATKKLYLTQTQDSGKYEIAAVSTLTQIYSDGEYQYITAPNLTYFNRLYENGHYTIKQIWILKEGKDKASTNEDDWDVYDAAATHFTNRKGSVKDGVVLIGEGTVIRLVFETTGSTYTNAVSFYDYDITDDGTHTAAHGINSTSNYSGTGAKLAFGNSNTDTGLETENWNGNVLNRYNSNGHKGCTFGLASHLSDGKIQYSGGVDVPNLFNDGSANGKTSYDGKYSLSFQREGDTYTLSAVDGASTSGLQFFNNPKCGDTLYTSIWTNNFWPMDSVEGEDGHTGKYGDKGTYIGNSGTVKDYPVSDDGLAHNNMFGMYYQVQFELTKEYVGPLEYYFFGDDDMWVFLDNTLVCDIGGVHSSVGEYVNLWDYVSKGSEGTHTLSFFYTERGLSGSTCYMRFTLPSVSSITPEQNTGSLRVEKTVTGISDCTQEFDFGINLTDSNGALLLDDYSYTRYDAEGKEIEQDLIIATGGSFKLRHGEYVVIQYLPFGTNYIITETPVDGFATSIEGVVQPTNVATGTITAGNQTQVHYYNHTSYVLPSTGGVGTVWYTASGLLLLLAAGYLLLRHRREADTS